MSQPDSRQNWRLRLWFVALALITGFGLSAAVAPTSASAEELVDLTLLFHGSVQGKIAPCG